MTSPEAAGNMRSPMQRLLHLEWNSSVSDKPLFEGVALKRAERWGFMPHSASYTKEQTITAAQEAILESGALIPVNDSATGRYYRATWVNYTNNLTANYNMRFAATYVTGAHQIKVGIQDIFGYADQNTCWVRF